MRPNSLVVYFDSSRGARGSGIEVSSGVASVRGLKWITRNFIFVEGVDDGFCVRNYGGGNGAKIDTF